MPFSLNGYEKKVLQERRWMKTPYSIASSSEIAVSASLLAVFNDDHVGMGIGTANSETVDTHALITVFRPWRGLHRHNQIHNLKRDSKIAWGNRLGKISYSAEQCASLTQGRP
jgi:hypothetical protein